MRTIITTGLVNLVAVLSAVSQSTASVGTLQVTVTDNKGAQLAGVEVRYQRIVRTVPGAGRLVVPAPGEAIVQNVALAAANGASTVPSLPVGDYIVCGGVPSLPYLDPCKWAAPPRVTVSANASAKFALVLTKGVFLRVRINDPKGLLPTVKDGVSSAGNLIVGVKFRSGGFHGAENTGVDSAGRDYQIAVPAGEPLQLWLFSRDVALTDAGGKPVDAPGALIPFQARAGTDQVFTFTVSGSAPFR